MRGRISGFVAGVAATVLVGAAAVTAAIGIPDSAGVIHACYGTVNGQLRVVADESQCKNNEAPIQWNRQGIQGPPGEPGARGETGAQGERGQQADLGLLLDELAALDQRLDTLEAAVLALGGDTGGGGGGDGGGGVDPDLISYGTDVGECVSGIYNSVTGQIVSVAIGPSVEIFDGLDNDCDGSSDEGSVTAADIDGDGIADAEDNCPSYPNLEQEDTLASGVGDYCLALAGLYLGDCRYRIQHPLLSVHFSIYLPMQPEIADRLDNDCDGQVDEDF